MWDPDWQFIIQKNERRRNTNYLPQLPKVTEYIAWHFQLAAKCLLPVTESSFSFISHLLGTGSIPTSLLNFIRPNKV